VDLIWTATLCWSSSLLSFFYNSGVSFDVTTINLSSSPTNVIPRSSNIISYHSVRGLAFRGSVWHSRGTALGSGNKSMGYNNMCLGFYYGLPIHFTSSSLLQEVFFLLFVHIFVLFKSSVEWKSGPGTTTCPAGVACVCVCGSGLLNSFRTRLGLLYLRRKSAGTHTHTRARARIYTYIHKTLYMVIGP
jgi:hypothetical protein